MGKSGKPASTVDSDGDGLTDVEEAEFGTDPNDADSDGDGLTDFQEFEIGTDPNSSDTDGDSVGDGKEVLGELLNVVEYDFNNDGQVDGVSGDRDPARWDADGDGEVDPGEYVSDPNDPDTDDDGSSDYEETYSRFTDPKDADTDDDGISDGDDPTPGTDDYGPADPRPDDDAPPVITGDYALQSRLSAILEARAPGPEGEIHSSGGVDDVAKALEPQPDPTVFAGRVGPRPQPKEEADGPGFGKGDTSSSSPPEPALERDADFEAIDLPEPVELPPIEGDGSLPDDAGVGTKTLVPEPEPAAVDDPDGLPDA